MSTTNKFRKPAIITFIIIGFLVILIFIAQILLSNLVEEKVISSLSGKSSGNYNIQTGNVKVNLFTMTLIIKDIDVSPDSLLISQLIDVSNPQSSVIQANIPVLRIRNIGVLKFLNGKNIDIGRVIMRRATIDIFTRKKPKSENNDSAIEKKFSIENIHVNGINGGIINKISISGCKVNIIEYDKKDTIFHTDDLDLHLHKIGLVQNESDSMGFSLDIGDVDLRLKDDSYLLPGGEYLLELREMRFNLSESALMLKDLSITPLFSRKHMVGLSKYQKEIYNVSVKKINVQSIDLLNIVKTGNIYLSDIMVNGMNLSIFKDKRLPFNETKRPLLPNQLLKGLDKNVFVDSIDIKNSQLIYSEQHDLIKEPMTVTLADLSAGINNITSIKDSIESGINMAIRLTASLQKKIPMSLDLFFPMKSTADTFMFAGYLGKGNMNLFNSVVLPALGMKFHSGVIDGVEFSAKANPHYSIGTMTMKYHDLEGEIQKHDMVGTKKFLSWLANVVITKNNPVSGKDVRTVPMFFDRVMYKGIGNFLWKTLQSGILGTIVPTVENRTNNQIDERLGIDSRTRRNIEKEKKRKDRDQKRK